MASADYPAALTGDDPLLIAARLAWRLLGARAWTRKVGTTGNSCEIGVRNPKGQFERRAVGATWGEAMRQLLERKGYHGR